MTGTGTQADPYIVDNWTEFMMIDTNSAEIFVRWADAENKTIDFNDIMPEGFSATVNFPAYVDFNGWTLRNFHSTAKYAIINQGNLIENLIFENFYITQCLMYGAFLLKNCIFSGIVQTTTNVTLFSGCGLQNSSLNIRTNAKVNVTVFGGGGFSSPKTQITNSDVILDILCKALSICDATVKNSRISGKIQVVSSTNITLEKTLSMSNIFNVESNYPLKYSSSSISVFNSDIAEKSSDSNASFVGVNSEQLKNAEYLYSIGFPIGID